MECTSKDAERSIEETGLIVSFPWRIPGLDYEEYILTALAPESPFYFLRSTTEPQVGLILVNPFTAYSEYEFDLDNEVTDQLKITDEKQVVVLCTVNTSRGIESATVNLLAPIVVNTRDLLAKQVILNDKRYSLQTPLVLKPAEERGNV